MHAAAYPPGYVSITYSVATDRQTDRGSGGGAAHLRHARGSQSGHSLRSGRKRSQAIAFGGITNQLIVETLK